ncbi:MAG: SDR family NAD(P)-dependent oxidoreductase [Chloroflexi bacterium]|nr:MAG: SDR family NAD(P)-dependent oxidoreductase [Chloroflexota bacterium]MBL1192773.1 SDR family oxidoreductase [Chloroflexota bacterium]NOH10067.1 SDR family oxidoreductase [Chloroflexota bacterium]
MSRFKDQVVLVTGSGSGIGRATALRFSDEGASLVIVDINEDHAQKTTDKILANGGKAVAVQTDVSQENDCKRMVAAALEEFGRLDVAFNNAGVGGRNTPLMDLPVEDWDALTAVNQRGIFLSCKHEMQAMTEHAGKAIVNMGSSTAGWDVIHGGGSYMASKEAIEGITKSLALEAAAYGIRVNAICPGIIQTPLSSGQSVDEAEAEAFFERFRKRIPLRRIGQPEDVADAVLFLASDDARHVTGTTLLIDGGQTLQSWSNAPEDSYPLHK